MSDISLRDVYFFNHLTDEKLAELEQILESRSYKKNEILFNLGDVGDELFIVQQGLIAIFAPSEEHPGEERPIRIFRTGGVLGEMALIDHQPRSLSARALENSWVLALTGENFRRLLRNDPDIATGVMIGLTDRIRYTTEFLNEVRGWVGKVAQGAAGDGGFLNEVRDWVKHLAEGEYEQTIDPAARTKFQDQTIATLAAEFAQMAAAVQQREEALRQEIAQLKVEIDEAKRKADVADIMGSDYFQSLRAQAKTIRQARDDDED
jgi:CRP-like cAMP-binding protein